MNVCVNYKKMLQYERINISEGIDINKLNKSKECMIYHCWYFNDIGFKFESYSVINVMIYQ